MIENKADGEEDTPLPVELQPLAKNPSDHDNVVEVVNTPGPLGRKTISSGTLVQSIETHSGPLPTAKYFADIERVVQGGADRVIMLTENTLQAEIDDRKSQRTLESRALFFAFFIVVAILVAGVVLLETDKPIAGYGALITGASFLAAAFVNSRSPKRDDDVEDEPRSEISK